MLIRFAIAALAAVGCTAVAQPSAAAIPAFAAYFSGTWSCATPSDPSIVRIAGASPRADAFVVLDAYDTPRGYVQVTNELYTEKSGTTTLISEQPLSGNVYVATSPGFNGNDLVFTGTISGIVGPKFERMTYTRVDQDHFRLSFSIGSNESDAKVLTEESCTRLTSRPVPSPTPQL